MDGIDELSFLTHLPPIFGNNNDRDTIWNDLFNRTNQTQSDKDNPTRVTVFKNKDTQRSVKNYYAENIYNKLEVNPYSQLLADFHSDGSTNGQTIDSSRKQNTFNAVALNAADFAYLTKLGVYPINRLWILRRFKEGDLVPDNLLDWGDNQNIPFPIATVIGWIPEDETNFFNVEFSETWVNQKKRIDQVFLDMLEKEFNAKSKTFASIPGWSQGILMGFLNAAGETGFNFDNIPFGNPDVLQEAATRVADNPDDAFGLKSTIGSTLKTSYEQKFIGDVDPGSAMLDIIRNLTMMGTSDIIYFLNNGSKVIEDIRNAANNPTDASAWIEAITSILKGFITAISTLFNGNIKNNENTEKSDDKGGAALGKFTGAVSMISETILASTVAKWKWPMRGGIGVMTGENTTPWHLTIGNPYSPFVSMGNVIVESVSLDFNNDLGFNDIPTKVDVDIKFKLGRNIGAQEIFALFNNGYKRVYDTSSESFISLNNLTKDDNTSK